jgi:hypothetical protein
MLADVAMAERMRHCELNVSLYRPACRRDKQLVKSIFDQPRALIWPNATIMEQLHILSLTWL